MPVPVLIVDDHELVRRGLASMLRDSGIRVVAEATTGAEAVRLARRHKPAVVLLDVRLGSEDGLDSIRRLRTAAPAARVLAFSAFDNPTYVARAVSAGAHDYLLKSASRAVLISAINGAAAGDPPTRAGEMRRMASAMASQERPAADLPLTPRETQVLRNVAMGLSNREIADALGISVETVKEHVQNLLRKVQLADRTQAAVWALRNGLVR